MPLGYLQTMIVFHKNSRAFSDFVYPAVWNNLTDNSSNIQLDLGQVIEKAIPLSLFSETILR